MYKLYIQLIKWYLLSSFFMRNFQRSIMNFRISQINYHLMLQAHVVAFSKHFSRCYCCLYCRCQWLLHCLTPDVYRVRKDMFQTTSYSALVTSLFVKQWVFFSYSAAVNTCVIGRPELKAAAERQTFAPSPEELIVYNVPLFVRSEVATAVCVCVCVSAEFWCVMPSRLAGRYRQRWRQLVFPKRTSQSSRLSSPCCIILQGYPWLFLIECEVQLHLMHIWNYGI